MFNTVIETTLEKIYLVDSYKCVFKNVYVIQLQSYVTPGRFLQVFHELLGDVDFGYSITESNGFIFITKLEV